MNSEPICVDRVQYAVQPIVLAVNLFCISYYRF